VLSFDLTQASQWQASSATRGSGRRVVGLVPHGCDARGGVLAAVEERGNAASLRPHDGVFTTRRRSHRPVKSPFTLARRGVIALRLHKAGIDDMQREFLEHVGSLPATSEEAPKASS
jgi:hypothetical protein